MARLIIKTAGLGLQALELRLGVNRVGRSAENDFQLNHPSISTQHCELILSSDGVVLRDCESTNGTFVNDRLVNEVWLESGQLVKLGSVELLVESTEANIAIPAIERPEIPKPPVVLEDGAMLCPRHSDSPASFKCTNCREIMCSSCIRMVRIKGGKPLFLCCICHQRCERIVTETVKAKKGFFGFLQDTIRLKFGPPHHHRK